MAEQTYRTSQIYKKSCLLVKNIYTLTKHFPKEEQYGLANQLKHAATKIPSSIAQGYVKDRGEKIRSLHNALAACTELETLLFLTKNLEFGNTLSMKTEYTLLMDIMALLKAIIEKSSGE